MKENDNNVIYNEEPTVSELNRVNGFNPLKYARRTSNGAVLDLPYQKLWFRLRHPNGKIRLFINKMSDKISAVEARVYFDRQDTEPAANYIVTGVDILNRSSVTEAQCSAIGNALADAGFGLQFAAAKPVTANTETKEIPESNAVRKIAMPEIKAEAVPEPQTAETVPTETIAQEKEIVAANDSLISILGSVGNNTLKVNSDTGEVVSEMTETVVSDNAPEENTEEIEEQTETAAYDKNSPIEEIYKAMSLNEALNYVIEGGPYSGWTVSKLAERRPQKILEMTIEKYPVQDNILRAAIKLVLDAKK